MTPMTTAYRTFLDETRAGTLPGAGFALFFHKAIQAAHAPQVRYARFLRQSPLAYLDDLGTEERRGLERIVELLKAHVRELRELRDVAAARAEQGGRPAGN